MTIGIYTHPDCLQHDTGDYHPENAGRLKAVLSALEACHYRDRLKFIEAPMAKEETLLLAHTATYTEEVRHAIPATGLAYLDMDTVLSPGSWKAALRAVGAVCQAVDDVMRGTVSSAFCAIRPPGHHATKAQGMGFCLFNSIAIATLYALKFYPINRVAIVDFDVHHGNGTEDILQDNSQVLYISTHQSPLFPGTGARQEIKGNILNLPLPAGTDGKTYRAVFEQAVIPALEAFKPELLLVSAGFDGHRDDPLAQFSLVEEDYAWIGQQLQNIAGSYCKCRVISVLEGGYNLHALGKSVAAYLEAVA